MFHLFKSSICIQSRTTNHMHHNEHQNKFISLLSSKSTSKSMAPKKAASKSSIASDACKRPVIWRGLVSTHHKLSWTWKAFKGFLSLKWGIDEGAAHFIYYKRALCRRSLEGLFLRCLRKEESIKALEKVH